MEEIINNEEITLTPKMWAFYRLLKSDVNKWWSKREICDAIPDYKYIEDPRNPCAELGKVRIILNASSMTDKIILCKNHCFKIATTVEEYLTERTSHIKRLKTEVAEVYAMDRKYEQNGQGKLFNNVLNELKPDNEQFHETFVETPKQEPKLNGKLAFVDLISKKAFIVDSVWEHTLNEETHIAYITTESGTTELESIYEVITTEQLERPFYEDYAKQEIKID